MNYLDKIIGQNHLLKRSIILLKAWFTYEGSFLGSYAACMATYALYALVIYLFNYYHKELRTPMDVFRKFFLIFGSFDWESYHLTIYGPVKACNFYERLKECNMDLDRLVMLEKMQNYETMNKDLLFSPHEFEQMMIKFSGVRLCEVNAMNLAMKKCINQKFINIIDPTFTKNNLGRSISKINYSRIKYGLKSQQQKIGHVYKNYSQDGVTLFTHLISMFKNTFEACGVHPPFNSISSQLHRNRENKPQNFQGDYGLSSGSSQPCFFNEKNASPQTLVMGGKDQAMGSTQKNLNHQFSQIGCFMLNEEQKLSPISNKDQDESSGLLHESEQRLLSNEKMKKTSVD